MLCNHEKVRAGHLRDRGGLASALSAPFVTVYGRPAFPTVYARAARLADGVSRAQAYQDGNKRLAFPLLSLYLQSQRMLLTADQREATEWIRVELSTKTDDDLAAAVGWLRRNSSYYGEGMVPAVRHHSDDPPND